MRRRVWLLVGTAALAACSAERPRPGPVDPGEPANLAVRVLDPANGETVLGGKPVIVRVEAEDLSGEGLTGIGLTVRHGATTLDSQVVSFAARADTVHVFQFPVPNTLPNSTQLDLRGLAFGLGDALRASAVRSVVMIQCTPQIPVCQ